MKKQLLLLLMSSFFLLLVMPSCSRREYYTNSYFESVSARHRLIAILPAEMVLTGTPPKNLTPDNIASIEEKESLIFQQSLLNGILRNANGRHHVMTISVQDIGTTARLLEENHISVRSSWKADDIELAKILGVDAVVRMRVTERRYMSDLASYGIHAGTEILSEIGAHNGFYVPGVPNKTNDIYASCNIVSNDQVIWNDNYRGTANYNYSPELIINNITEAFGRHFPYKRRI